MVKEVKTKPVAHIYAFAAVWLLWALFLPMYKLWHFITLLAVSLAARFLFARLFPGKTIKITVPDPEPAPFTSGNPEVDALLREGASAMAEIRKLRADIEDTRIQGKLDEILEVSEKIIKAVKEDPSCLSGVKRFLNYYLPTTLKLLHAYDRMYDQGIRGKHISGSMQKIDQVLDTLIDAYNRQLDSLFAGQALDIETDIAVMEGMLKQEGLSESDFNTSNEKGADAK